MQAVVPQRAKSSTVRRVPSAKLDDDVGAKSVDFVRLVAIQQRFDARVGLQELLPGNGQRRTARGSRSCPSARSSNS
jgi:hypothetical protein